MSRPGKVRLNVWLTEDEAAVLQKLQDAYNLNRTEALRRVLRQAAFIECAYSKSGSVMVEYKHGETEKVKFI